MGSHGDKQGKLYCFRITPPTLYKIKPVRIITKPATDHKLAGEAFKRGQLKKKAITLNGKMILITRYVTTVFASFKKYTTPIFNMRLNPIYTKYVHGCGEQSLVGGNQVGVIPAQHINPPFIYSPRS